MHGFGVFEIMIMIVFLKNNCSKYCDLSSTRYSWCRAATAYSLFRLSHLLEYQTQGGHFLI